MPSKPTSSNQAAHDILAAEEFVVPAPDPELHRDDAHDVLAAEEFIVPARDPALNHGPVLLPDDPTGIVEAHDVLAAEEFALPAPRPTVRVADRSPYRRRRVPGRVTLAAGAGISALLWRRLLRDR